VHEGDLIEDLLVVAEEVNQLTEMQHRFMILARQRMVTLKLLNRTRQKHLLSLLDAKNKKYLTLLSF
jgi:ATP-dependent exoDNAse (exonuclease V) alpha subunit